MHCWLGSDNLSIKISLMLQHLYKRKGLSRPHARAGFTLIEILIVAGIIGILASLILASFVQSKKKAKDAAIISSLIEVRNAAELFRDNTESYDGVCDAGNTTLSDDGDFGRIKQYIEKQNGDISCRDSQEAYATISSLNMGHCWCVDSSGASQEIELSGFETCSDKLITTICP